MIELALPYPPSGNHMWKHAGAKHYLTKEAVAYYGQVAHVVRTQGMVLNLDGRLHVTCALAPPDKRRRDLDNAWKVIADALTRANLWQDDKHIRRLTLEWLDPQPGGAVALRVAPADATIATC